MIIPQPATNCIVPAANCPCHQRGFWEPAIQHCIPAFHVTSIAPPARQTRLGTTRMPRWSPPRRHPLYSITYMRCVGRNGCWRSLVPHSV